jgi:hypothetical protein
LLPIALQIAPGIDTQGTALQNEKKIIAGNLVRFKNGYIQKLGGCQKICAQTVAGTARALFAWADLSGNGYLAIGTNQRLEILYQGILSDITPITFTSNLTTPFTTTAGSSIVTVDDAGYNPNPGDWINIVNATFIDGMFLQGYYQVLTSSAPNYTFDSGTPGIAGVSGGGAVVQFTTTNTSDLVTITLGTYAFFNTQDLTIGVSTTVGGITLFGLYQVAVSSGPVYKITASAAATSGASAYENSDQTQIAYLLPLPEDTVSSGAYGAGPYGAGPYGTGGSGSGENDQVQWTLDNWGEDLVAAYKTGTIYEWVPPVAVGNVVTPVSGAPSAVNGIVTAAPEQQLVAWGIFSATLSEQDPLLVGWCDVANLNDWIASATNQAGTFRLSSGSLIVSAKWTGLAGIIWTDLDAWAMTYIGFPLVYSFNKLAPNCGLIAQRAAAVLGTVIAWMSANDFFVYSGGGISPLACTVRDFVFNNLDRSYLNAIFAAPNTYFDEIAWWFPTIGSNGICNAYVKWNVTENLWDYGYGSLEVSAWTDQSVLGSPIGTFFSGYIEQFETSTDFDGSVLTSGFTSGWFELAEGEQFLFLERILPDFVLSSGGQITMTVNVADDMAAVASGSTDVIRSYGPYTISATTEYFIVRGRGRVVQIVVLGTSANTFWRYGKPLAVVAADGRR